MPIKWKSKAKWPKCVGINLSDVNNVSEDTHKTRIAAEFVCDALNDCGFDGEHKIYPDFTWVEPVFE